MSFEQQLISWRRELHQNPELSLQEVATTARIRDWLQSGGLTLLPFDLKTGLVAEVGSGDKVIALRADIDALPIEEATGLPYRSQNEGVMHACGRYSHQRDAGAALLLKEREAELPGRADPVSAGGGKFWRRENPDPRRGAGGRVGDLWHAQ
jgi:metal-dependent amidase/aminoacylase/carboxypeptidase family protein